MLRRVPVRSVTSLRNAASVGMNAVSRFFPWVSTPTGLSGLALSTVSTAFSTMSKSRQLWSNLVPSAASTLARLLVPAVRSAVAFAGWRPPCLRRRTAARAAAVKRILHGVFLSGGCCRVG